MVNQHGIRASTLVEQVADWLRAEIVAGSFAQGERLNEVHLATKLGVSRGPVREAIKLLHGEGFVTLEPNRGASIVRPSVDDIRELYELRTAVEVQAARIVARQHSDAIHATLIAALGDMRAATADPQRGSLARADLAFHEAVVEASGNQRLRAIFTTIKPVLGPLMEAEERQFYPDLEQLWQEHAALLDVLNAGLADSAGSAFADHLERAQENLASFIEGNSQLTATAGGVA